MTPKIIINKRKHFIKMKNIYAVYDTIKIVK